MKILHLCPYLYPAVTFGGPAEVVYQLAREQSKKHQVVVATSDAFSTQERISSKDKIKASQKFTVKYFKNIWNKPVFTNRFFTHFGLLGWFLFSVKQFDVVHIHDVFIFPQLLAAIIAHFFKIPVVFSPHGVLDPIRLQEKSLIKLLLTKAFVIPALKISKAIVATSEEEAKSLKKITKTKIFVVKNGIVLPTKSKKPRKSVVQLAYLGRLHKQKGLLELVDAIKELPVNLPSFALSIAGPDDGLKEQLVNKIESLQLSKSISIEDTQQANQKWDFLADVDLFVYPSYAEGFSISILEAMSLGIPVIITSGCNFDEVAEKNAGLIVPTTNLSKNLAQAISQLLENESRMSEMGANARKLVIEKFSIESMNTKIEEVYTNVI